ncbi:hypothetical protein Fmac_025714 [Flemingia macrophylla]|uniref:Anaphase-promoting complex subunit 4-like WD40 domain-containing protein n=1 Tax=Flemingia macrophylla TaxID=520843 RepID=A0ABD1LT15_9FABA
MQEVYRQIVDEKLTLDSEGKPFRMLVFRGSPKSSRKSIRHIDEMREEEAMALHNTSNQHHYRRRLPKRESRILDAPNIRNDYYSNIMDWGENNILAIALGSDMYLWNSKNSNVFKLFHGANNDFPTSVSWSDDAKYLAIGSMNSKLQLWDAETSKPIRRLHGHGRRIATIAWNGHILTSGSHDKKIINHDVRARRNVISRLKAHSAEVCGLKWSRRGNILASGGNENHIYVCGLEWNRHHKELLSGHGFSTSAHHNQLCLWRYPSMAKVGGLDRHASRVIHLSQSPDGLTVVSAGADETLRFWDVFGPPVINTSEISKLGNLLSLKAVYDDDIFDGVPGLKTSSSKVKFDDVFNPTFDGVGAVAFEDLLGGFGKEPKSSGGNRSEKDGKGGSDFDDLLAGFGNSSGNKFKKLGREVEERFDEYALRGRKS